jgi:excisionase family DNA binding protein
MTTQQIDELTDGLAELVGPACTNPRWLVANTPVVGRRMRPERVRRRPSFATWSAVSPSGTEVGRRGHVDGSLRSAAFGHPPDLAPAKIVLPLSRAFSESPRVTGTHLRGPGCRWCPGVVASPATERINYQEGLLKCRRHQTNPNRTHHPRQCSRTTLRRAKCHEAELRNTNSPDFGMKRDQNQTQGGPAAANPSLLLTIPEAAARLRISRSSIYRLFDAGELRWVRVCATPRVSTAEINRFITEHTEAAS